jgi:hypothetical protein
MAHRYGLNTELERTETNSRHPEFVRVSFSSLLIDCHEIPIFQTGLTGLTRCVLLFNPVILPGINKAQLHKSLNSEDIIRQGTQMTRIRRIYTDPCVSASSAQSV